MPANKTKPTELSVNDFIDALPGEAQRADAKTLIKLMQRVSGEEPKMWGPSIIGFGSYHYRYDTGREGDAPLVGFSPRKSATALYNVRGVDTDETLLSKLGKYTSGKGCLYVKKVADLNQTVLEKMIRNAIAATKERYSG